MLQGNKKHLKLKSMKLLHRIFSLRFFLILLSILLTLNIIVITNKKFCSYFYNSVEAEQNKSLEKALFYYKSFIIFFFLSY